MRYQAVVSFEYDIRPVQTYRGEIVASHARRGVWRAVEMASKAYPGAHWRSVVVVLEKLEDLPPEAD